MMFVLGKDQYELTVVVTVVDGVGTYTVDVSVVVVVVQCFCLVQMKQVTPFGNLYFFGEDLNREPRS